MHDLGALLFSRLGHRRKITFLYVWLHGERCSWSCGTLKPVPKGLWLGWIGLCNVVRRMHNVQKGNFPPVESGRRSFEAVNAPPFRPKLRVDPLALCAREAARWSRTVTFTNKWSAWSRIFEHREHEELSRLIKRAALPGPRARLGAADARAGSGKGPVWVRAFMSFISAPP